MLHRPSTGELPMGPGYAMCAWAEGYEASMDAYGLPSRFATPESLKEIHRVLRQGAVFGMIWNIEDCKSISLARKDP